MAIQKKVNGTWQSINPKKLKGIPYTGTLPAVITGTKAGYLHRYKVYGNLTQNGTPTPENPIVPSECGESTKQLFDISGITLGKWYAYNGALENQAYGAISEMKKINEGQLTIKWHGLKPYSFSYVWFSINKNYISRSHNIIPSGTDEYTNTVPSNAAYFILQMANGLDTTNPITIEQIASYRTMLNEGSTPLPYEPYGYKLPLTSGSTPVDIYIGDDTLSTEEYVDSGTGKIYRMVGGVLTPTDPPVPFPQIPTTINSTTISWAGSGLAPSEFDSIQEWVDATTYTRINGEWVADN